jgi:hypothetical protein
LGAFDCALREPTYHAGSFFRRDWAWGAHGSNVMDETMDALDENLTPWMRIWQRDSHPTNPLKYRYL